MQPIVKSARVAGAWYLLLVVTGSAYFIAPRSANSTLNDIHIVLELASTIVFAFLVRALYRLLKGVNGRYALTMVAFVLVSVTISLFDGLNEIAALFNKDQVHTLTTTYNWFLFGLWLFPFGLLVYKSGFIPRIFGVLLIANGFAYVAEETTSLLYASYANVVSLVLLLPMFLGEFSIMGWLLVKGASVQSVNAPS